MGSQENVRYLGIIDVHGTPRLVEEKTEEQVQKEIDHHLEKLRVTYPDFDWSENARIFEIARELVAERVPVITEIRLSRFEGGGRPRWIAARIPIDDIGVLPQPRKTFEEIETLAENIAEEDLINPLMVVRLDEENCKRYIDTLNKLWGQTENQISDLQPVFEAGEKQYYILIAGERRFRACKYLQKVGCEECREHYGPGGCFSRHSITGNDFVDVRLGVNLTPLQALSRQASENIHMPVPAHEEAKFYYRFFSLLREENSKYPLTQFARLVGRKVGRIRDALKYCSLPEEVQQLTEKGFLGYGMACQLARLNQAGLPKKEFDWWVTRCLVSGYKLDEFDDLVTKFLQEQNNGNASLFDIFSEEARREFETPTFRKVVEGHMVKGLWGFMYYWARVIQLSESGKLGPGTPFSELSTVRIYKALIEKEIRVLAHIKRYYPKRDYEPTKAFLEETLSTLLEFERQHPNAEAAIT